MLKTILFLISFLLIAKLATAQLAPAPQTQWSKCYGGTKRDGFSCMIEAHDNGLMAVGSSESKDGNMVTTANKLGGIYKLNKEGRIEWHKSYGNDESGVICISKYPTGGYVLCGASCKVRGDVTQNKGMCDYWVLRINDTGKIIWQKSYGGSNGEAADKIIVDKANNIYVGGSSQSYDGDIKNPHINFPYVSGDMWIIKLDPNGNLIWEHSYGGTSEDAFYDMCLTPDNNILFCGRIESTNGDVMGSHLPSLGYRPLDAWVVKIDTTGAILWQRPCGGSLGENFEAIAATTDSGCVLVGATSSFDGDVKGHHEPTGQWDAWIVKLNKEGKLEWQKCLGGSLHDGAFSIVVDKEGNYLAQINTLSTDGNLSVDTPYTKRSYLLKLNKQGDIIWKRFVGGTNANYPNANFFHSIIVDKDNSIYGAGQTYCTNFDASSSNDVDTLGLNGDGWIMKFYPEIIPIKVIANNTLNIYPNPASSAVYIATQNIKEIRFIDVLGRVYINKKIDNTNNAGFTYFPLNYIANGTYMVQAITKEGEVKTGKLVVVK